MPRRDHARRLSLLSSILVLLCSACAGGDGSPLATGLKPSPATAAARQTQPPASVQGQLPALSDLPRGAAPDRESSATFVNLDGSATFQASGNVTPVGSSSTFDPSDGHLAYALYRFNVAPTEYLDKLYVSVSDQQNNADIWIGLSNYQSSRWVFYKFDLNEGVIELEKDAGIYSSGQFCYVAALCIPGGSFSIDSLSLQFGNPPFLGWQHTWGSSGSEVPRAVRFDGAGNVIVVGEYDGGDGAGDADPIALLKYSPSGQLLQSRTIDVAAPDSIFGAPSSNGDELLLDAQDNIYISGSLSYSPDDDHLNNNDGLLVKVDKNFNVLWARRLRRDTSDGLGAMAFDKDGNVLVAGSFASSTGQPDLRAILLRVSPNGDLQSQQVLDNGLNGTIECVTVDTATNDIFLSGRFGSFFDAQPYFSKIKGVDGSLAWSLYWDAVSGSQATAICYDGAGGATITCDEPDSGIGGLDEGVVFLNVDADGVLTDASLYEVAGVDINPDHGRFEGGVLRTISTYYQSSASKGGMLFLDFAPGAAANLHSDLFIADFPSMDDWAYNGAAWAFSDSALISIDGTAPYKSSLPAGFSTDLTEDVVLADSGNTLGAWDATWTSEGDYEVLDTPGVQDVVDSFEVLTTYFPEAGN